MQNTVRRTSTDYPYIADAMLGLSPEPHHRAALVTCGGCGARVAAGTTQTDNCLCTTCYDSAGLENEHSDGYHAASQNGPHPACTDCQHEQKVAKEWEANLADADNGGVPFTPEDEAEFLEHGSVAVAEEPKTDADGYLILDDFNQEDGPWGDAGPGAVNPEWSEPQPANSGPDVDYTPEVTAITGDTTDGTQADAAVPDPAAKPKRKPRAVKVVDGTGAPKRARKGKQTTPVVAATPVPAAPNKRARTRAVHKDSGPTVWQYWGTASMQLRCKECGKSPDAHDVYPDPLPTPPAYTPGYTKAAKAAATTVVPTLDPESETTNPADAAIEGVIVTG